MSGTKTQAELIAQHGIDIDPQLDREISVPVSNGLQRQGDILVVPTEASSKPSKEHKVGAEGVAVVRGEAGGNTHLLLGDGPVFYAPVNGRSTNALALGTITVPEGSTGYLAHPEHGYAGIAPGTYTVNRQREQADEIRLVQD
jgi:hypothetical protein